MKKKNENICSRCCKPIKCGYRYFDKRGIFCASECYFLYDPNDEQDPYYNNRKKYVNSYEKISINRKMEQIKEKKEFELVAI